MTAFAPSPTLLSSMLMRSRDVRSWLLLACLVVGCSSSEAMQDGASPPSPTSPADAGTPADGSVPGDSSPSTEGGTPIPQNWAVSVMGEMPMDWEVRDGAEIVQLASGRLIMEGGWNFNGPWLDALGQPSRLTNQVWASDDLGVTWFLLLAHDPAPPDTGPTARFLPNHVQCLLTHAGHAVLIGGDWEGSEYGDVWVESNNGARWTRTTQDSPTALRSFAMCASYKGALYVMGGQVADTDPSTALNDVWRSTDLGVTWTQLPTPPWSPRGVVQRLTEHEGKLYLVGGGRYGAPAFSYNGVFSFDGTTWQTILPDGHAQFEPSAWHTLSSVQGRLWLLNGYNFNVESDLSRATFTDNGGSKWSTFAPGSGGVATHADAVVALSDRIVRIPGGLESRTIYKLAPVP
jgi:hypothetical protein